MFYIKVKIVVFYTNDFESHFGNKESYKAEWYNCSEIWIEFLLLHNVFCTKILLSFVEVKSNFMHEVV